MTAPSRLDQRPEGAGDPRIRRRTPGTALMAATLFAVSLFGLASAFVSTEDALGFEQPLTWKLLLAATSVLGIWSGWEIWRRSRRAERAYLLWCAIGTSGAIYYVVVLAPKMIAIAAEIIGLPEPPRVTLVAWLTALALHVALLMLGWWYLRLALRRGSTPHEAGTAVP